MKASNRDYGRQKVPIGPPCVNFSKRDSWAKRLVGNKWKASVFYVQLNPILYFFTTYNPKVDNVGKRQLALFAGALRRLTVINSPSSGDFDG